MKFGVVSAAPPTRTTATATRRVDSFPVRGRATARRASHRAHSREP